MGKTFGSTDEILKLTKEELSDEILGLKNEELIAKFEKMNDEALEKVRAQKNSFSKETYERLIVEGKLMELIYKTIRESPKFEDMRNKTFEQLIKKVDG